MLQSMRSSAKFIWWFLVVAFVGSFLLYETSGLAGKAAVTTSTAVATVNGEDILYTVWQRAVAQLEAEEQQRLGHSLTLDERRTVEDQAFDQLVSDILLQQEYKRRGISVTDDEIIQAARTSPPPQILQAPELQTDGRFDPEKYRRYLSSTNAKQGLLPQLEAYYRSEIPRQKLFDQVSSDVYLSDERLWQIWRDRHDSATVSFVTLRTDALTDTAVTVTDAEISAYYERNKKLLTRPGRAVLSLLTISRTLTAEDSAAAKTRIDKLRAEIVGGAKFEDVARRESIDSSSAVNGGSLGKGTNKGRFVAPFEKAIDALKVGELSQPVLTPFGWHLIKLDERKGDTVNARHILVGFAQTDSNATRTDKRADSLAAIAGSLIDQPQRFDSAARTLKLSPASVVATEKDVLNFAGRTVPSASAWAFSGSRVGETSDLIDAPDAYYLVRLDSLQLGGQQSLTDVKEDIRRRLAAEKRVEKLAPQAQVISTAAAASTLESAAATAKLTVEKSKPFARVDLVQGLGQFTQAIGAAFSVPIGKVSPPVPANDAMVVLRVDARTDASKTAFDAQKGQQRSALTQQLKQQRVEEYMTSLRDNNKVEDHRVKVMAQMRRQSAP